MCIYNSFYGCYIISPFDYYNFLYFYFFISNSPFTLLSNRLLLQYNLLIMIDICNLPEPFTREISHVLLFDATIFSFNQNLRALTPDINSYLLRIDLHNPSPYNRKLSIKQQNHNDYYDVQVSLPIYDLSKETRKKLISFHKQRKYVVALVSQQEMLIVGNAREPFTLTVDDNITDNGKGADTYVVTLTGQTIIFPNISKVTEKFRVLFFLPPLQ